VSRCVRAQLDAGGRAVVLGVQRRVCHLAVEDGPLLMLSMPEVPLAPNALAVDVQPDMTLRDAGFRVGQVVGLGQGLDFETVRPRRRPGVVWQSRPDPADWRVTLGPASTWEPRPSVHRVAPHDLADRLQAVRRTVVADGAGESLLPVLWASESDVRRLRPGLIRAAGVSAQLLTDAAVRRDERSVARAARGLAGLGPGLTPSGDDLLAGFAAAWTLLGESLGVDDVARRQVTQTLVSGAERGASPLGQAWLGHACRGELLEPMTRFVAALLAAEPRDLDAVARGALAVGSSSGTDWMVGFLLGASAVLDGMTVARPW
jgi:Protein of unknown function (DUF2877)